MKMVSIDDIIDICDCNILPLKVRGQGVAVTALRRVIDAAKEYAVDAELVKHGRWIGFPECLEYEDALDTDYIVCSECHHVWNVIDNCTETFKCCPSCGARMDGGEEDEE